MRGWAKIAGVATGVDLGIDKHAFIFGEFHEIAGAECGAFTAKIAVLQFGELITGDCLIVAVGVSPTICIGEGRK